MASIGPWAAGLFLECLIGMLESCGVGSRTVGFRFPCDKYES